MSKEKNKSKVTFELTKVFEGQEASEPNFFYIDEHDRIYYGHTKAPNFCDEGEHELIQLIWNGSNQLCPMCDSDAMQEYQEMKDEDDEQ